MSLAQQSAFELCFSENFRTEKQRFLGGLCFYEKFRTEKGWIFWGIVLLSDFRTEKHRGTVLHEKFRREASGILGGL